MMAHIRSRTFGRFKEAFDSALKEGKAFVEAAHRCTDYFMAQFEEASAGILLHHSEMYHVMIS